MSLRELNPATRRRLRWHGWLLTGWCVAVGMLVSWVLLRGLGLRAPAGRYAISAVLMYAVGWVVGVRFWLAHFSAAVRQEADVLGAADRSDRVGFDAEERQKPHASRIGEAFDWGDAFASLAELLGGGELSLLLVIPALVMFAVGGLMAAGYLPMLWMDGVAALLAEMAIQFVFGALLVRGVMRPQAHEEAFLHIVGKTWIAGVLLVLLSALAGWLLAQLAPGAASIGDLWRHAPR